MATKNNIRSMRFSDDILALIQEQPGDTFTAKFELLVMTCVQELPRKQWELEQLESRIQTKREEFKVLADRCRAYDAALNNMRWDIQRLQSAIERAAKDA